MKLETLGVSELEQLSINTIRFLAAEGHGVDAAPDASPIGALSRRKGGHAMNQARQTPKERAFASLRVNERPPKPRTRGVTEIRESYYTPAERGLPYRTCGPTDPGRP